MSKPEKSGAVPKLTIILFRESTANAPPAQSGKTTSYVAGNKQYEASWNRIFGKPSAN